MIVDFSLIHSDIHAPINNTGRKISSLVVKLHVFVNF